MMSVKSERLEKHLLRYQPLRGGFSLNDPRLPEACRRAANEVRDKNFENSFYRLFAAVKARDAYMISAGTVDHG